MTINVIRHVKFGALLAVALGLANPAPAQTAVKFSLDWKFEGTQAPFLLALDRGYFKAEGLDVTIDTAGGSVEPINRIASRTYDMAFADINSLIKFRDQNPQTPLKAIFMIYSNPPFAIVTRKSRGVTAPKDLEGKKLGAPAADGAYAQWPIFVKANDIDAAKVEILNVGFPVREPMLVSGHVDAITGFSFSTYINVKHSGVAQDDIVVMLMANYGVKLYGNTIMVNPSFAADKPQAVRGFLRGFLKALKETAKEPAGVRDGPVGPGAPHRKAHCGIGRDAVIEAAGITVVAHAGIMAADIHRIAADVGAAAVTRGPDVPGAAGKGGLRRRRGLLAERG